jgi:hypothetical protein
MIEYIEITILGARPLLSEFSLADLLNIETYELLSALKKSDGNDKNINSQEYLNKLLENINNTK